MSAPGFQTRKNPCRYRPRDPALLATFRWFIEHGHERRKTHGLASNSYIVARDMGIIPLFAQRRGTHAYAAAMAGLCNRQQGAA